MSKILFPLTEHFFSVIGNKLLTLANRSIGKYKKYKEVQRSTEKYQEVRRSTKKYEEVARSTKKYKEVQRSTEVCFFPLADDTIDEEMRKYPDYDIVSQMPYMDMFPSEVLRMYPIANQAVQRRASENTIVQGIKINKDNYAVSC
jgi:cytochrome P450